MDRPGRVARQELHSPLQLAAAADLDASAIVRGVQNGS